MFQDPIVKTSLEFPANELHSYLALAQEDIKRHIQLGVQQAVDNIGPEVIQQVEESAKRAIKRSVEEYFTYGEGAKQFKDSIFKGLSKIFSDESH